MASGILNMTCARVGSLGDLLPIAQLLQEASNQLGAWGRVDEAWVLKSGGRFPADFDPAGLLSDLQEAADRLEAMRQCPHCCGETAEVVTLLRGEASAMASALKPYLT